MIAAALLASAFATAQVAPKPGPAPTPPRKTIPVIEAEPAKSSEAIVLTPFEVNTDKDDGFSATNAGTATKLGLDMKDMAAPYTVMTGEFLEALGLTNLQDAALWSTNAGPVVDAQGADQFAAPSMYNIRGVTLNAGQQRNFFTTASIGDTYNAERIDFGRGPNAVLFNTGANNVLGGGISMQTKRARVDRNFETIGFTVGSWDYYRSTLDVNRTLTDKIAVRANVVWQDRGGWMDHEFEKIKGITVAGTYRIAQRTELRIEALNEKVARTRPTFPSFDRLSGWDGVTVFNGPITNAMLSTTATPGATYGLTFSGEPQGIERVGNDYVYIPGQSTIMNWTNTARSRRGDSTPRVPIYSGSRVWTRDGNAELLSFGNWATQQRPATPSVTQNGDQVPFRYTESLPDDRFDRAIAHSSFRPPGKRFTNVPDDPLYTQWTNSASIGFTHQVGERLFFDASANYNRVHEKIVNNINGFRDSFLDLNRLLPDGSPNPHFLDVYGQGQERIRERWIDNGGVRANLNYILNLGKWGNYTFNLTGAMSQLKRDNRQRVASVALAADPREWQGQAISIRNYWNEANRTFEPADGLPTTLFNRVPSADGNSFTTSTGPIGTHWVLNDWGDETEIQKQTIFAFAGKYFGDRLVVSGGARHDNWSRAVRSRLNGFGFMPVNASWDGFALDDRYWRPNAPTDWANLTYIPKNPDGTPRSTVPILAVDRPTVAGPNGVNLPNPLYANDRFRNDYNAPKRKGSGINSYVGVMVGSPGTELEFAL